MRDRIATRRSAKIATARQSSSRSAGASFDVSAAVGPTMASGLPKPPRPGCDIYQQLADEAARRLIGQLPLLVEFRLRGGDHHLGFVEEVHVEKDAGLPQV